MLFIQGVPQKHPLVVMKKAAWSRVYFLHTSFDMSSLQEIGEEGGREGAKAGGKIELLLNAGVSP